ncbi:peroxiredoxin family protein [bacterium]|nr:peroxiredoxin family protein [bacterium]
MLRLIRIGLVAAMVSMSALAAFAGDETDVKRMPYENPPAEAVGTLAEGVGIAVGEKAPDARVMTADGKTAMLREVIGGKKTVLVFYRGGWCPYCNFQIHELTGAYPGFQKRGFSIVAISVDKPAESAKTQATYTIPFPLLSDQDLAAHDAYRVTHEVDDEYFQMLKQYEIDIEAATGRKHHKMAVPSIFVIDENGVVAWAHADRDYKRRPSAEQILQAIDGLAPAPGKASSGAK